MVMARRSWILVLLSLCLACGGGSQKEETTADTDDGSVRLGTKHMSPEDDNSEEDHEGPGMWWYPEDDSELFVITSPWPPSPNEPVQVVVETGMGDWDVKLIEGVEFQLSSDGTADDEWISMQRTELDEFEDRFDATVNWPSGLTCVHVRLHKSSSAEPKPYNPALVKWLHQQRDARGKLTVVVRQPQPMAPHTTGVGYRYHWNRTSYRDIEVMVTQLDTDYVLVRGNKTFSFMRSSAWQRQFELVGTKGGHRIFRPSENLVRRRATRPPTR